MRPHEFLADRGDRQRKPSRITHLIFWNAIALQWVKTPPNPQKGPPGTFSTFRAGFFALTRLNTLVPRGAGVSRRPFGVRAAVCAAVEV